VARLLCGILAIVLGLLGIVFTTLGLAGVEPRQGSSDGLAARRRGDRPGRPQGRKPDRLAC
jgi:hypothetical protein